MVEIVQRALPVLYLYRSRTLPALSSGVAGVETFPDGVVRLSRAAFLEDD